MQFVNLITRFNILLKTLYLKREGMIWRHALPVGVTGASASKEEMQTSMKESLMLQP